jgi:Polysaccharide lyase family 4, domain II
VTKLRSCFFLLCLIVAGAADLMAQGTGTIKGHIKLTGKLPGNPIIRMGMDPMCSKMTAGKRMIQEYVVASIDGSLANVFVRLQGTFPRTPVPTQPVVIDQSQCIYGPRVVGARVGQSVQVKNSDNLLHNIDASSAKGNGFNFAQPRAGLVYEFKPKAEEVMMHLKCDVHNWMNAYIGIVDHPYFAVSNTMGNYEISKVPPGTYTIEAWQEKLGTVKKTITVKAGGVTNLDLEFMSTEPASPSKK